MKEVKNRNEQFERIASIRDAAETIELSIISIDTKKKEMLGNFKRNGKALSNGRLESFGHDFSTFSDGMHVQHGIYYDVIKNVGYMTMEISYDTSKFVCDNIKRVWENHLKVQYPEARTIVGPVRRRRIKR